MVQLANENPKQNQNSTEAEKYKKRGKMRVSKDAIFSLILHLDCMTLFRPIMRKKPSLYLFDEDPVQKPSFSENH